MEEENKKECKKIIDSAWFYIIVSIAIILYLIFIVTPYAVEADLFSEAARPDEMKLTIYRLMIWPIFIIYLIYVKRKKDTFNKYIKTLIYPLTAITIVVLIFYFLITLGGGSALWLLLFIIPLSPFLLVGAIIYEVNTNKRKKQQNKNIQEEKHEQ